MGKIILETIKKKKNKNYKTIKYTKYQVFLEILNELINKLKFCFIYLGDELGHNKDFENLSKELIIKIKEDNTKDYFN